MDLTSGTIYQAKPELANATALDAIYRVKEMDGTDGGFTINYLCETPIFVQAFLNPLFENAVLRETVKNLWKTYQYNQEYISFLLKTRTREEFLSRAKEFSTPFRSMTSEQLCLSANVVLRIIGQPLSSADLSLLLNVDPSCLENSTPRLLEYKPEATEPE